MEQITPFDKTKIYKTQIEEKINELVKLCNYENIPMFIAVCVSNDQNETVFKKEAITAATRNLVLADDIIPKLINVTLGFDTVPSLNIPDIEFE